MSFPLDPSALVLALGDGTDKIFHFSAVLKEDCAQAACYEEAKAAGKQLFHPSCLQTPLLACLTALLICARNTALLRIQGAALTDLFVPVESVIEGFNVCIMAYGQVRSLPNPLSSPSAILSCFPAFF